MQDWPEIKNNGEDEDCWCDQQQSEILSTEACTFHIKPFLLEIYFGTKYNMW